MTDVKQLGRLGAAIAAAIAVCAVAVAQPAIRRATFPAALAAFPTFFHGQPVVVRGVLETRNSGTVLTSPTVERPISLVFQETSAPDGPVEVRATFWDLGRLDREDSRIQSQGLSRLLPAGTEGDWPRPGDIYALIVAAAMAVPPSPSAPTLRTMALEPSAFEGKRVTISGQFRGRNLYGDLPQAPHVGRWDFVLRAADAAIWVTGQRPRGRGFNLDIERRIDTGHWLEATGVLRQARGVAWIEASQLALATPPSEAPAPETDVAPIVGPSPEVVFSDPTDGETDVPLNKVVRLQFSRDMKAESFEGHIRGSYSGAESLQPGTPERAPIAVTNYYDPPSRSLELRIEAGPANQRRTVTIDLGEGIVASDGATLQPWSLTFTFGGI